MVLKKEICLIVDISVENTQNFVENHLLLAFNFCAKVVQNLALIILSVKSIMWTLDVPSERYSRQVQ